MESRLYRVYALTPSERAARTVVDRIRDRGFKVAQTRILAPRDRIERGVFLQTLAGGTLGAVAGGLAVWMLHRVSLLEVELSLPGITSIAVLLGGLVGVALAGFIGVRVRPSDAPPDMEQCLGGGRVGIAVTTEDPDDAERVRDYMASMSRAVYGEGPPWLSRVSDVEGPGTDETR